MRMTRIANENNKKRLASTKNLSFLAREAGSSSSAGFTLIETMVAVGVIVVGVVSALGAINTALFYVSNVESRLIAVNLTAEGIEVARNIRDNNWLKNLAWNSGLADGDYEAAYNSTSLSSYSGNNLLFDSGTGLYSYAVGGSPTYYARKISIANLSPNEIRVISSVTWQRRGVTYASSAEDHFYNWK